MKLLNSFIKLKKIIYTVAIFIIIYVYFSMLINTNFDSFILDYINDNFNINKPNIKNELMYSSLNKIAPKSTLYEYEVKEVSNKVVKENKQVKKDKPIVYIYNTHESEKYMLPYISDYSVVPTVRLASFILKDYLNDYGIESFVQTKSIKSYLNEHKLDYTGSYEASRVYMESEFKNNDYKILIDIHRDSAKHKYTLFEKNKKKYAKIMFVLSTKHKNYKKNEEFVNDLVNRLNKEYKGITRGILKRSDVIFNQDKSNRAILLELGGVDNTLEEVNNTLDVFAKILYKYVSEEIYGK